MIHINFLQKLCAKCSLPKPRWQFQWVPAWGTRKSRLHSWCRDCKSAYDRTQGAIWLAAHREEKSSYDKARAARIREEVILAYGGKCSCCGNTRHQFLSIDHANGGGNEHRRQIKTGKIYEWLKRHGFPKDGFQLLCFNCNCARGFFGYCCIIPQS